jgi:hypothetical protein
MLSNLFSPLIAKVLGGLSIVLLLALGVQSLRAAHYKAKAESCEAGREADRDAYAAAQVQAKAAQDALNSSISARYEALAEKSHAEYQKALADAHSAAERYIASHRLPSAVGRPSGSASATAQGHGSPVPDDPATAAELVAVRAEDVRDCTVDYSYGRGAYDFIQGLIADKLAIPAAGLH